MPERLARDELGSLFGPFVSGEVKKFYNVDTRQGGPNAGTTVCDLVMLLNTKFAANGEDHRKFAGFVAGLIK